MSSISDILQQTLDLIGTEKDVTQQPNRAPIFASSNAFGIAQSNMTPVEPKTASSILLEERKKLKNKVEEINAADFSAVSADGRPKPQPMSAYLNQVTSASVDTPKYWKSKKGGLGAVSSNKKVLEKRGKGSDYNDRFMNKLQSKESKQKLKNRLKGK